MHIMSVVSMTIDRKSTLYYTILVSTHDVAINEWQLQKIVNILIIISQESLFNFCLPINTIMFICS